METRYNPQTIEHRARELWETLGVFAPAGDGEPYCIVLPPPNVTGTLHMGHAFQATIMDCLCRHRRLLGERVLWQPGTDHAGIATQIVVAAQMAKRRQTPSDIGRDAFIEKVWDWKRQSGGTITRQLRRLGASLDWSRERFTMDESLSVAVREAFVRLHRDGLIYRGKRLVNWDPVMQTAVSDLEVVSEEENGKLWELRYPLADADGCLTVATTRPETMFGDTAVAVHPDDERHRMHIGKTLALPLTERRIPIIADEHVDMEFGTGCVKVTPAHDFNDYEIGRRHDLPLVNIFNDNATLNDEVPEDYRGLDRYVARERVVADLTAQDLVANIRDHRHTVPRGERSGQVLEPRLSDQWFVRTGELAKEAAKAVRDGRIQFIPENWSATYFDWLDNIQDWCISRQIWWGHRIPAWFDDEGRCYVARNEDEARAAHGIDPAAPLRRDDDVLDTWFSSALWPFTTMGWPEDTPELRMFHPGSVLVTGFDIIFFWVARMVMMGLRLTGEVPFKRVYVHGLVRDAYGQKMSKSKGNTIDPLDLSDGIALDDLVEKRLAGVMQERLLKRVEADTRKQFPDGVKAYGVDAVRFTFLSLASTGRDIRFDLKRLEGYRNFCNKLWNATRFVFGLCGERAPAPEVDMRHSPYDAWIQGRLNRLIEETGAHYANYRFDLLAHVLYDFVWRDYCDWFLEFSKIIQRDGDEAEKAANRVRLVETLDATLRLLHPLIPFITEEIWTQLRKRRVGEETPESVQLCAHPSPAAQTEDELRICDEIERVRGTVGALRRVSTELGIAQRNDLPLLIRQWNEDDREWYERHQWMFRALGRVDKPRWLAPDDAVGHAALAMVGTMEYLIPVDGLVDLDKERARLDKEKRRVEKQLAQMRGQVERPDFVNKAPEDIVREKKRQIGELSHRLVELDKQSELMR